MSWGLVKSEMLLLIFFFPGYQQFRHELSTSSSFPGSSGTTRGRLSASSRAPLSRHLNQMEDRVAEMLVKKHGSAKVGIIGSESIDKGGVERRPSSVYWNGLRIFNLIHTRSSLNEFIQSGMNNTVSIRTAAQQALTEEDDRDAQHQDSLIHLDRYFSEWMDQLTIHLTETESKFLVEKIRHSTFIKDSALSQILANDCLEESLSSEFIEFSALAKWLSNNPQISITCARGWKWLVSSVWP